MARHLIAAAALAFSLTGCVAQEKYNALKLEKDQLVESLSKSQAAEREAEAQANAWKAQLDSFMAQGGDLGKQNALLMQELGILKTNNAELNRDLQKALSSQVTITGGPLTPALTSALQEFAAANPDIVEFNAATGTIKFKSDVTFAKGSADLTPQARSVIDRFATILNSSAAASYEIYVQGHTDATPVSNPETIKRGHLDNWYLSSHRAISVGKEMIGHQVAARRIGVLGFGDQRPVASNATSDGMAKNRRVEVVLLPSSAGRSLAEAPSRMQQPMRTNTRTTPKAPVLNKDSAILDSRPVFNK